MTDDALKLAASMAMTLRAMAEDPEVTIPNTLEVVADYIDALLADNRRLRDRIVKCHDMIKRVGEAVRANPELGRLIGDVSLSPAPATAPASETGKECPCKTGTRCAVTCPCASDYASGVCLVCGGPKSRKVGAP